MRKPKSFILLFLISLLLLSQSLTVAFALDVQPSQTPTEPYSAEEYLMQGLSYHDIKNPSSVVTEDILLANTVEFTFISDSDSGLIYGFSSNEEYADFVIDDPNISSPQRLRIIERRFLLVLDSGDIHIFDWRPDTPAQNLPVYAGKVDFAAEAVSVKDFIVQAVPGPIQQLYIITENDTVYQFALRIPDFICDLAGDLITVQGLSAGERPVALSCFGDWIYILCTKSYVRFYIYHNSQEVYNLALDKPYDIAVVHANEVDQLVLISDNGGISSYERSNRLRNKPARAMENTAIKSGEIVTVTSISLKNNILYTADTSAHSKCVQSFAVNPATGGLTYNGLFVGSKGGDQGRLYSPSGVTAKEGKIYISDTQNKRIQIWEENTVTILDTRFSVEGEIVEFSPTALTAVLEHSQSGETSVKLFVAANERILEIESGGNLIAVYGTPGDNRPFRKISSIASSIEGTIYIADETAGIVYVKSPEDASFKIFKSGLRTPSSIGVSALNGNVYIAERPSAPNLPCITVFQPDGTPVDLGLELDNTHTAITALSLDDRDTVFLFAQNAAGESDLISYVLKTPLSGEVYYEKTAFTPDIVLKGIRALAICETSGKLFFADTAGNSLRTAVGNLGIYIPGYAPGDLEPPVYIKNGTDDPNFFPIDHDPDTAFSVRVARVVNYTGTLIYPVSDKYQDTTIYPNYPTGHAIKSHPASINQGENLLVLDDTFDNYYAYVLYKGMAGFIKKSGILILERDTNDVPYRNGLTLYSQVEIFKFPSLKKTGTKFDFLLTALPKDTPVQLVCRVPEYSDNSTFFYEIKYATSDSDPLDPSTWKTGFVRRYHITPDGPRNTPAQHNARIKAEVNNGIVSVYESPSFDSLSPDLYLRDNTEIEIINDWGDGWIEVKWNTPEGERSGFVRSEFVIFTGLTTMQIVGIVILVLALITTALTLWLRKPKKSLEPPSEPIRF